MPQIFVVYSMKEGFELGDIVELGDILLVFIAGHPRKCATFRNLTGRNKSIDDWKEIIIATDTISDYRNSSGLRYFLITIRCNSKVSDYTLQQSTFPSRAQIVKDAAEEYGDDVPITILNIFEFKTDEDYYSFISK